MKRDGILGPALIILLGVLLLVNNLAFQLPFGLMVRNFWPFLLIAVGLAQILGSARAGRMGHSAFAGLITLTIGTLFALHTLFGIGFHRTWPVVLIAVGVGSLLQLRGAPGTFRGHRT